MISLGGCYRHVPEKASMSMDYAMVGVDRKASSGRGAGSAPPPPAMVEASMDEFVGGEPSPEPEAEAAAERKVHYSGWCALRATRVDVLLDAVSELARSVDGFVENLGSEHVTIRVPVADFDETWDQILTLGEVVDHSLTAEDVTESFLSIDLRLKTARTTRERLQVLLAKAEEEEKIALLKQIQRLTEEIDRYEVQLRVLGELADFARITVQAMPSSAFSDGEGDVDLTGFEWIRALSPWRSDVTEGSKLLALTVPEGLVALDEKHRFAAESPDGARIWTGRLMNEPRGDTPFWIEAITERIASEFADAEAKAVGDFQVLRLVDPADAEGYRYLIGVRAEGKHLDLVQIYYPTRAQEERYEAAMTAALQGGAS
jgi:hypothetical protein